MTISDNQKYFFAKLALEISKNSHCIKKKVGAVIVKNEKVISTGYNNPSSNLYKCDQDFPNFGCPRSQRGGCLYSIHAEQNAILFAYKNNICLKDATIFITLSPCLSCARLILGASMAKVIFIHSYAEYKQIAVEEGNILLKKFGVNIEQIKLESILNMH